MKRINLPVDHNDTHHTHPRTLWEAFKGRGDMFVSETPLISPEDKPFVVQVLIVFLVSLVVFIVWG
jgi:hypothetical protein